MANPYEGIPGLDESAAQNERRRQIAEAMFARAQEPVQPFTQSGRMVVPMSWTQGLAKLAEAYFGGRGVRKADKEDARLASERERMVGEAMAQYRQGMEGAPAVPLQSGPGTSLGAIPAGPEQKDRAAFDLMMNRAVPENVRQVAGAEMQMRGRREDKAEEREFRREDLKLKLETDLKEAEIRSSDKASDRVSQEMWRQRQLALQKELGNLNAETQRRGQDLAHGTSGGLSKKDRNDIVAQNSEIYRVLSMMDPVLESSAGQATGVFAALGRGADATVGQLIPGQIAPETQAAAQRLREFNQEAKKALVNNPRFPVAEQEVVSKLLPTGAIFQNPSTAVENFKSLKQHLENKKKANEDILGVESNAGAPTTGPPASETGRSYKDLWRTK